MPKQTFKGINADDKLLKFISSKNISVYQVTTYSGKCNTPERMVKIEYLNNLEVN